MTTQKTWAPNDIPTASDFNVQFQNQVVAQVTSATRPAGVEGQHITESDTDREYVYSGSGWVEWGGYGAWTSYTPTLTQSGAVTKTVNYAKYFKIGRQVTVAVLVTVTGTGTAANIATLTLPFTAATTMGFGTGLIYDSSAGLVYPGLTNVNATTTMALYDSAAQSGPGGFLGLGGFTAALANGDQVNMGCTYEAAS